MSFLFRSKKKKAAEAGRARQTLGRQQSLPKKAASDSLGLVDDDGDADDTESVATDAPTPLDMACALCCCCHVFEKRESCTH